MLDVHGKTAVISGGAEGIGFSLAKAFGGLGMNVVITDIESAALERAEAALKDAGTPALGVEMDVSVREDWQRTADLAEKHFGDVHMLVNNAGVGGAVGPVGSLDESGWRWAIDVNLMGVVYGANTFIPRMRAHDEPAWVINVASIAGMAGVPYAASYTATKAAVVALTEAWAGELAKTQIRVSVLAPAFVKTRIHESYRNRQERFAPTEAPSSQVLAMAKSANHAVESGIDPSKLSARVVEALEAGETYIFTHPAYRRVTDARHAAINKAFDSAAASPSVKDVLDIHNFADVESR